MVWEEIMQYSDYIISAAIFLFSVALARAIRFLLKRYAKHAAQKTRNQFDDILIDYMSRPLTLGISLAGLYFAITNLGALAPHYALLNKVYTVLYIIFGGYFAMRLVGALVAWYSTDVVSKTKTKMDEQFLPIIRKAAYGVIWFAVLLSILGYFGIEITGLVAALGVGGLAVALAFQDTLKEFFAGGFLVADRPIRIGDFIELESGEKGNVIDIGWRSTKIKILGNNMIIVPNSKLAGSKIINYNYPEKEMGITVSCGVSYKSDLDKVEKVTVEVAREVLKKTEGAVPDFEPLVRYEEFGDSNIKFLVVLRVKSYTDRYMLTHEFIKALKKRYEKEKIEIAYPSVNVYQRKS
jgi:small-conductance mechanosensitive channel